GEPDPLAELEPGQERRPDVDVVRPHLEVPRGVPEESVPLGVHLEDTGTRLFGQAHGKRSESMGGHRSIDGGACRRARRGSRATDRGAVNGGGRSKRSGVLPRARRVVERWEDPTAQSPTGCRDALRRPGETGSGRDRLLATKYRLDAQ